MFFAGETGNSDRVGGGAQVPMDREALLESFFTPEDHAVGSQQAAKGDSSAFRYSERIAPNFPPSFLRLDPRFRNSLLSVLSFGDIVDFEALPNQVSPDRNRAGTFDLLRNRILTRGIIPLTYDQASKLDRLLYTSDIDFSELLEIRGAEDGGRGFVLEDFYTDGERRHGSRYFLFTKDGHNVFPTLEGNNYRARLEYRDASLMAVRNPAPSERTIQSCMKFRGIKKPQAIAYLSEAMARERQCWWNYIRTEWQSIIGNSLERTSGNFYTDGFEGLDRFLETYNGNHQNLDTLTESLRADGEILSLPKRSLFHLFDMDFLLEPRQTGRILIAEHQNGFWMLDTLNRFISSGRRDININQILTSEYNDGIFRAGNNRSYSFYIVSEGHPLLSPDSNNLVDVTAHLNTNLSPTISSNASIVERIVDAFARSAENSQHMTFGRFCAGSLSTAALMSSSELLIAGYERYIKHERVNRLERMVLTAIPVAGAIYFTVRSGASLPFALASLPLGIMSFLPIDFTVTRALACMGLTDDSFEGHVARIAASSILSTIASYATIFGASAVASGVSPLGLVLGVATGVVFGGAFYCGVQLGNYLVEQEVIQ